VRRLLNRSRRWTEVDYKMSGFTKEWEWHDLTPLAAAARRGQCHIVRLLLNSGVCDPTLSGCYADNETCDAFEALGNQHFRGQSEGKEQCTKLLEAAKPFWPKAQYSGCSYKKEERITAGFPNKPSDVAGLREALAAVEASAYELQLMKDHGNNGGAGGNNANGGGKKRNKRKKNKK
jgi:hypothetical protein